MRSLPRRTFLKGIGASIALPVLDAMRPAFGATAVEPMRLMVVYAPTGKIMQHWTPAATGTQFEYPRILKPMEPHRNEVLVLSGLAANNGRALGDGAGDHARAASSYLTGVHPRKTEGSDIRCGVSMDQLAAAQLGKATKFASLELTCEDSRQVGSCDSYSCAYQSISWKSETQPLPPEMNPRAVFERLFGDSDATPEERVVRRSVLDLTYRDAQRIHKTLGATDRRKLDEYLTAIREIEVRMDRASTERTVKGERPAGIPTSFREHARLMFDLSILAFQADATRVVTFMLAREGGLLTYPEAGVPEAHHSVTHHRNDPDLVEKVIKINTFHVEQFAYFVSKLKASNMLDRVVALYGSPLGDPNAHDHGNLPALLVGGNGRIRPGRHVRYAPETPVSNLHVSLLDMVGVRTEKLGDSSGRLGYLADL